MARRSAASDPLDAGLENVAEEMQEDQEISQAEVGDIAMLDNALFEQVKWSVWRFRTDSEMRGDSNSDRVEYVGTIHGPIEARDFQQDFGGGVFDLRGYAPRIDANGNKRGLVIKYRPKITVAGPRKDFTSTAAVAAPGAVVAAPVANGPFGVPDRTDRLIRLMLKEQRRSREEFREVLREIARPAPQATPPLGLGELVGAMVELKKLSSGESRGESPIEMAQVLLHSFQQGITLGQEREPIPADGKTDPNPWGPVLEKGLDIVNQYVRAKAAARPGPPPRPPSSATVVDPPPANGNGTAPAAEPPPAAPAGSPEHRWHTAVEAVWRGMLHGRPPEDLAASLEDMLNTDELNMLRGTPGEQPTADNVLEYLGPLTTEFPDLTRAQGKVYLTDVLAALRAEPEPE